MPRTCVSLSKALAAKISNGYERAIHLFDGNDPDSVDAAREQWKSAQAAGHVVTYWQQDEAGRWQQKA